MAYKHPHRIACITFDRIAGCCGPAKSMHKINPQADALQGQPKGFPQASARPRPTRSAGLREAGLRGESRPSQALDSGRAGTLAGGHPIATPPESRVLGGQSEVRFPPPGAQSVSLGCRWGVEPLGSSYPPPMATHPLPSTQKLHRRVGELLWTPRALTLLHPPALGGFSQQSYFLPPAQQLKQ